MNNLVYVFEEILNENPNQAIKFLKDKKMDPATNPKGRQIMDKINGITKGDGYTFLLTKFHVNERMPLNDLQRLYERLRTDKNLFTRLPRPVVNYDTYRDLANDIGRLVQQLTTDWLLKQLSPDLRQQTNSFTPSDEHNFAEISKKFRELKPDKQRHFMKKVFGFKDIHMFMDNVLKYIKEVNSEQDYESTKAKIGATPNAHLVYDHPEQDILIAHINSLDAMKALACTSAWCIAKDMVRYRQYKAGENIYFLIWDYNYPIDNPNFFIATAYNPSKPLSSATHEHINDTSLMLGKVMSEKNLNQSIFDEYIEKFKKRRKEEYEAEGGMANALKNGDADMLINMVNDSTILKEYSLKEYIVDAKVSYDGKEIELNIDSKSLIKILELGDDYESIARTAEYSYENYADESEAEYMHNGLNDENNKLLITIAKKLGIKKSVYKEFAKQGDYIKNFLENHKMEDIVSSYVNYYGDAQAAAEQAAAKELVDQIPFDIDDSKFDVEKMFNYYVEHNLTAKNFDELLNQIKENVPEFLWDSLSEARYTDLDLDELNREIKEQLEKILSDIEYNEDSPYYEQAKLLRDSENYLERLGFQITNTARVFAQWIRPGLTIYVHEIEKNEDDEDNPKVMAKITITKTYGGKKGWAKTKPIVYRATIPITSIKNYIYQYQIPFKELKEEIYRMIKLITEAQN
jgi:hypothetical protein